MYQHPHKDNTPLQMLLVIPLVLLALRSVWANEVIVDTEYGKVLGKSFTLHDGNTVNRFFGIPFAKPPVGDLRWRVRLF